MHEGGLISPGDALSKMQAQAVPYLDVRSEEEFHGGHPLGAYNVPLLFTAPGGMQPNPDFVAVVRAHFERDAPLIVGCRAGNRSRQAITLLAAEGYTQLMEQRAGWGGVRNAFGQAIHSGWLALGLPAATEAQSGRDYESLSCRSGATPGTHPDRP